MKVQPKYVPYGESSFFEDGRAMRPQVAGTVSREHRLGDSAFTEGLTAQGTPVEQVPFPLTREAVEAGRARFDIICATCHGRLGDGRSVVARKMSLRPPPSLHAFRDRPPGFFFRTVSLGFGFMPRHADVLTVEERWQIVGYLGALLISQSQPVERVPPDVLRKLQEERP